MTSWRPRFQMWLLLVAVQAGYAWATGSLPNTPAGMLLFHGSAALFDCLVLWFASILLSGSLLRHTQWLLFASIAGNACGWWLYMAYVSPSFYNIFMWVLTAAQWLRLFIPDSHAPVHPRNAMVRRGAGIRSGCHS